MAAYAALVSLMNNIEQIQCHTRLSIHFDKKQSQSLLTKVYFLIDFLESYNYHGAGKEIKNLESRIRDAAYTAEDIIETHVVDTIHARSRSGMEENEMMNVKNPTLSSLEKVVQDMDSIKDVAIKLKDVSYKTQDLHPTNPIIGSSISVVPAGKINIVGFDDELRRITDWLLGHHSSRQVIPIVGMGGIGKTTLTKTAYDKFEGGKYFDICAWVTISQEYDLKRILLGLLRSDSSLSDNELGDMLHKRLYRRRYLIVLDDMWSVKAWEMVNLFLPDNSNGSRIIITTRESSVSTCFRSSCLEMSFLDDDQSWNLFCGKVFSPNDCPLELEEVGRTIVKNCKGLPLSIVVIGGLLAKSERRKKYWEYIAQDTIAIINSADDEQCMKILSLSYQNLPVHLKPCFLYLGAFSEDEKFSASMLIKLWVAEGFLKSNCSKELEVLGREYLNDLASRNLIMVDRRGLNNKIKFCMIHDLLRDICLQGAQNEKFMYAPRLCSHNNLQFVGSQRRISFHKNVLNKRNISQVLEALRPGSMARTLICNDLHEVLPLQNFRLTRVLNYIHVDTHDGTGAMYSLNDIFKLVNSRLIKIRTISGLNPFIPSSLRSLLNLRILIVTGVTEEAIAPLEIWEMTELRHLGFHNILYLPDPPSQQMNGQAIMKKLHTLKYLIDFRLSDEVVKRIPNIRKLYISYEYAGNETEMCLKNFSLLEKLESLTLRFKQQIGSDLLSDLTFPNSLAKLSLNGCGIPWKYMSIIASIPRLQVLKLMSNAFIGPEWVLDEEVFQCLKYLLIFRCKDLVEWIADDTNFPCLEHLQLESLKELVEIPPGFGDIPTLQSIEMLNSTKSAVISAKKILDKREELGDKDLHVTVSWDKDDELESLASENFIVCTY